MLLAQEHTAQGWAARGTGFADTVTPQGWQEFGIHMRQSAVHLLTAWELHPEYPEAAGEMIRYAMAMGGVAGESERFWFDRAFAADPRYGTAFANYRWALRPRWGGSHSAMLAFGEECLAAGRHDLGIAEQYHRSVIDVWNDMREMDEFARGRRIAAAADGNPPSFAEVVRMPGVYENYRKLFAGEWDWLQSQNRHERGTQIQSRQAAVAFLAGRLDHAAPLVAELGDAIDRREIAAWGLDPDFMRQVIRGGDAEPAPGSEGHSGPVLAVIVTPDGRQIISGGADRSVRFHDVPAGTETARLDVGAPVLSLAVSPDGKQLAVGVAQPGIQLWDAAARKRTGELKTSQSTRTLAFSPDGEVLASGGVNTLGFVGSGELLLWNVAERTVRHTLTGHSRAVTEVAFSPDGRTLVSAAGKSRGEVGRIEPGEMARFPSTNRWRSSNSCWRDSRRRTASGWCIATSSRETC